MRYQDQVVKTTQRSLEDLFRTVRAMPEDRLNWKPEETSRSALDLVREVTLSGTWILKIARGETLEQGKDHAKVQRAEAAKLAGIDACESEARQSTSQLCALISDCPTENLEDEVVLPFGKGMTVTMADLFGMHHSHIVYHTGQVNYIQTLYGDPEMH